MKRFYAAVLSGGSGSRFGAELPKQFALLGGVSILRRSLLAFEREEAIAGIVLVAHPDYLERSAAEAGNLKKLLAVVPGGATRTDSTAAALAALPESGCVLLHDAARPLVSSGLIGRVIEALAESDAVSPVVPVRDTVYVLGSDGAVEQIPARDRLAAAQTPQGFDLGVLRTALAFDAAAATDDAAVVLRSGGRLTTVAGEECNFKITTAADLARAEAFLRR